MEQTVKSIKIWKIEFLKDGIKKEKLSVKNKKFLHGFFLGLIFKKQPMIISHNICFVTFSARVTHKSLC